MSYKDGGVVIAVSMNFFFSICLHIVVRAVAGGVWSRFYHTPSLQFTYSLKHTSQVQHSNYKGVFNSLCNMIKAWQELNRGSTSRMTPV